MKYPIRGFFLPASLALLTIPTSAQQQQAATAPGPVERPAVTVTPIVGNDVMAQPTVLLANLDAGNLVAGRTWWEYTKGVFYIETFLGFLWSPQEGATVFEVPLSTYFAQLLTSPNDIADDKTVVGGAIFTTTFQGQPFRWTPATGFQFLDTPAGLGGASAVSADGDVIGGTVRSSVFADSQAARWNFGVLDVLGPAGQHSLVSDASGDGSVLVGEIGSDSTTARATRWLDGVEVGLDLVPGASFSKAEHVADDGSFTIGRAVVGAQELLVRWAGDGTATTFAPPGGLLIENLNAINPDATAVVGSLSDDHTFYQGNWVPFLWTLAGGFTLLGELGLPDDYDVSQAVDVSDDGTRVVGELTSWVFGPGSEPPIAFLWTPADGTRDLELLVQAAGGPALGLFDTVAISGDGRRIVATGTVAPTLEHSGSVILNFLELP